MTITTPSSTILLLSLLTLSTSVRAQYYGDNGFTGQGYGTRIGIGVGVAVGVAAVVLLSGYFLRKRRASAFKAQYPVQPVVNNTGYDGQPIPMMPQQNYQQEQQAPAYNNYRNDAGGYSAQGYNMGEVNAQQQAYAPPSFPPPTDASPYYPPPSSPPPAHNGEGSTHYAPPPGPPPAVYDPSNVNKV